MTEKMKDIVLGRETRSEKELETVVDDAGKGFRTAETIEVGRIVCVKLVMKEKYRLRAHWRASRSEKPSVELIWDTSISKT